MPQINTFRLQSRKRNKAMFLDTEILLSQNLEFRKKHKKFLFSVYIQCAVANVKFCSVAVSVIWTSMFIVFVLICGLGPAASVHLRS